MEKKFASPSVKSIRINEFLVGAYHLHSNRFAVQHEQQHQQHHHHHRHTKKLATDPHKTSFQIATREIQVLFCCWRVVLLLETMNVCRSVHMAKNNFDPAVLDIAFAIFNDTKNISNELLLAGWLAGWVVQWMSVKSNTGVALIELIFSVPLPLPSVACAVKRQLLLLLLGYKVPILNALLARRWLKEHGCCCCALHIVPECGTRCLVG